MKLMAEYQKDENDNYWRSPSDESAFLSDILRPFFVGAIGVVSIFQLMREYKHDNIELWAFGGGILLLIVVCPSLSHQSHNVGRVIFGVPKDEPGYRIYADMYNDNVQLAAKAFGAGIYVAIMIYGIQGMIKFFS